MAIYYNVTHSMSERKTKTVQPDMNTSIAWDLITSERALDEDSDSDGVL